MPVSSALEHIFLHDAFPMLNLAVIFNNFLMGAILFACRFRVFNTITHLELCETEVVEQIIRILFDIISHCDFCF